MRTAVCTFLLFAFGVTTPTEDRVTDVSSCSKYDFHTEKGDWKNAKEKCAKSSSALVSMETDKEWHFVWNLTKNETKRRWFIGLFESANSSYTWCWLSKSKAWVNKTSAKNWRWGNGEPNNHNKEKCVEMMQTGEYNNIKCQDHRYADDPGYICEKQVDCSTASPEADIFIEEAREPASTRQLLETKTTATSLRTQMTNAKTEDRHGMLSEGTTFKNTVRKSSWQNFSFGKINLVLIVIVLLAVFILAIAVVFGILFCRRHQGHKNQDHLHDRVTCSYEVPPSSELQSIDPVHVQQTQNSTELTVHLTLSQTECGLTTYETGSDCKKENEYDDMNETNGKSRSESEGSSEIQEREREKAMMIGGKKGIEQPPTFCGEKEENKDNVYAVVHKERKNKVNSEASVLKTSPGRPQEGASGLPVNMASGVDCTGRSSHQTDLGPDNIAKAAESETPQTGGNNEYLYAAVDMTTKKKKPPQMPPPYRGLVYADLAHTRENSAKLVQEQSQTVYAQIDHVKTASVKISQQNLEETKEGEHK